MIRQGHSRRKHAQLLDWDHDEMTALLLPGDEMTSRLMQK